MLQCPPPRTIPIHTTMPNLKVAHVIPGDGSVVGGGGAIVTTGKRSVEKVEDANGGWPQRGGHRCEEEEVHVISNDIRS